jgi:hypothetical protein
MTPPELQAALAQMPARSQQIFAHRFLEERTPEQCAALYGLTLAQWDVLFLGAVNDLEAVLGLPPSPSLPGPSRELESLQAQRAEVKALIQQAHRDYEASPAYSTETWLRRIAIIVILGLTAFYWWRDRNREKPIPNAPYLTIPKKS